MNALEMLQDSMEHKETYPQTLARHYEESIENSLARFERRYNRRFKFSPDKYFWEEVYNTLVTDKPARTPDIIIPNIFVKDVYNVVYKIFYTKIVKEIVTSQEPVQPKGSKELEYVLSSLTREQFDYFMNRYYFCTIDIPVYEIEELIARKFTFHSTFAWHSKNNIHKRFKNGEALDTVYMHILSTMNNNFIEQINTKEKIKPTFHYQLRENHIDRSKFKLKTIIIVGIVSVLLLMIMMSITTIKYI